MNFKLSPKRVRKVLAAAAKSRILVIGDVMLEVTQETQPCSRMEKAQPGLRAALAPEWRGGVCCTVVSGGYVRVSDAVTLLDAAPAVSSESAGNDCRKKIVRALTAPLP